MRTAAPLLAAALVRGAVWAVALGRTGERVLASGDTASYLEPGRNLLLRGVFQRAGLPEVGRTPGYPLFLALLSGAGLALAALAQCGLSVANVWLTARLARACGASPTEARWAAWLMAFEPLTAIYAPRLLAETLFCTLLLLSLEELATYCTGSDLRRLALGGVALTAATFVRPASYFLPLLWSGALVALFWREGGRRWQAAAVLLATTVPFLAAWQARNFVVSGFSGFSSIAVRNSYFYSAAEVTARAEGRSFAEVQRAFGYPDEAAYAAAHREQQGWNEAKKLAFMRAEAGRILRRHWAEALREQVAGSVVVALTPAAAEVLEMAGLEEEARPERVLDQGALRSAWQMARAAPIHTATMALFELWLLGLYLLAARGALSGRMARPALGLLLGTALYFLAIAGGVQAVGRFRMPVMPVVCVLAGVGLSSQYRVRSKAEA